MQYTLLSMLGEYEVTGFSYNKDTHHNQKNRGNASSLSVLLLQDVHCEIVETFDALLRHKRLDRAVTPPQNATDSLWVSHKHTSSNQARR